MTNSFYVELIKKDEMYTDWAIWRKSTHELTLTFDNENKKYWSTIRVSSSPNDIFGDSRLLSDKITKKLIKLI